MKRNLLLGFSLLLTSFGYAQFTAVPDDNFEQALIDQGIDTNPVLDDQVLTSAISGLTFLNLTGDDNLNFNENEIGLGVQSLVGIKGFTSLETLWVQGNDLTDMDLAGMSSLKDVRAFFNDLQTVNINGLTNLEIIGLNQNNITGILVDTNVNLQQFDIEGNNLRSLDLRGLNLLTGMNVANNLDLDCILVEDMATAASYNANANFIKNGSTVFSENCFVPYFIEVAVSSGQTQDGAGNYVINSAGNLNITLNLVDENGNEVTNAILSNYDITIAVSEGPDNPATVGPNGTPGADVENINISNETLIEDVGIDFTQTIRIQGDQLFEADEFFTVRVASTDNYEVGNSGATFQDLIFKIVDDTEVTNVNLSIVENGVENDQNITLRLTSSKANNTRVGIPFQVDLQSGSATINEDFEFNNTEVILPDGASFVDFEVAVLPDQNPNEGQEDFTATISYSGNLNDNAQRIVIQNGGSVTPTITDDTTAGQPFTVSTAIGGDIVDVSGLPCCPEYEIEEGQLLEINFDAIAGAPIGGDYIVQVSFANGTATAADVSVRENSPNFQYTYSVKSASPDNILQIDIVDDMIDEPSGEDLKITLTPVGSNYSFGGATTVYDVKIKDNTSTTPFIVSTNITNAGAAPNYQIEEGQSFQLNFDTGTTGTNGTIYNPVISITKDGVETAEDFSIDNLDQNFTISTNDPDGSITFTANDDGDMEGDETYTITITSEDTNLYTVTSPLTFEVTVKDKTNNNDNKIRAYLTNAGQSTNYSVIEGNTFKLNFEALSSQLDGSFISVSISTGESTASESFFSSSEDDDFVKTDSSLFFEVTDSNPDESIAFTVFLDDDDDEAEDIIIKINNPNGAFEWENANEDGSLTFIVRIEDKPVNYANAPVAIAVKGDSEAPYEAMEGGTITFDINGSDLAFNGQIFRVLYTFEGSTAIDDIGAISASSMFILDLSDQTPDGTLEIEIETDQIVNEGESLKVTFIPEGNYFFENAAADGSLTFEFEIKDLENNPSPEAQIEVKPYYRNSNNQINSVTTSAPLRLKEGEGIDLSFELLNLESTDIGSYGFRIQTFNGTAKSEDGDFQEIDQILIIDSDDAKIDRLPGLDTSRFDDLVEILADTSIDETDENFYIEITPVTTNNIRLFDSVNNANGELLAIGQTIRFEVIIENGEEFGGQQFNFSITPRGDVTGNESDNSLVINEGQILELWVDAQIPNQAEGFSFQLEPLFDPKFANDIEIIENPLITVDNTKSPDGIIKIKIREDAIVDEDELIGLIFEIQDKFSFTNLFNFNGHSYKYIPFTVKNVSTSEYYMTWDNKGSLEGGANEEILIELKNKNGTPYTAEFDLEFDLVFDTTVGTRNPSEMEEYPSNTRITIASGASSFKLEYPVSEDVEEDNMDEFYRASIIKTNNNALNIELPEPLLIKVLDDQNPYKIVVQPFTKQTSNKDYYSSQVDYYDLSGCCDQYRVPEGSNYVIGFETEKGVPLGRQNTYTIEVGYLYEVGGTSNEEAPKAENLKDFINVDEDNSSNYIPKYPDNPDNRLIIEIFDDQDEIDMGLDPLEEIEKFQLDVKLDSISSLKFELQGVSVLDPAAFLFSEGGQDIYLDLPFTNTDIFINQVIPLSLEVVDGDINEENFQTDFAKIKIKRSSDASGYLGEVNLVIFSDSPNTDATEGSDYEPILKTIVLENNLEKEILIKALPDDIVDNNEEIRIGLAPGDGYSFSNENIIIIKISDEDVGDFDASIITPDENKRLFEDITLGPASGAFEVALTTNGESSNVSENTIVKFVINNEEEQPLEGVDYLIFDGKNENKRDITNDVNKYVTIKEGESKGYITIEVVQNDGLIESPETINIQLTSGEGYNLATTEASMSIISKEQDVSELDPADLKAFVSSATCPGVDQGKISLSNESPFDFTANLYHSSNSDEVIRSELLIRNNVDPVLLFDNLKAGNYEIRLVINDRPDILPPTFNLTIRANLESTQLLSSVVDSQLKVANLVVSGSKFYQIVSNDNVYSFKFDTPEPQKLRLPIQNGSNSLVISSEASCQGKIETELFLADYKVFPNPTKSTINFIGFTPNSQIRLYLFDTSGKMALSLDAAVGGSGDFEINVDFLPHGNYFGKILSNGKELLKVKLIKN